MNSDRVGTYKLAEHADFVQELLLDALLMQLDVQFLLLLRLACELFFVLDLALDNLDSAVRASLPLDAHPDLTEAT
jgi:hypothetical protein